MKKVLSLLMFVFFVNISAQEVIDKIIAVVGDEIILNSELEFQVGMYAAQRKLDSTSPELKKELLNKLIEDKLMYEQSLLDSIEVSDDDVNRQLEQVISYYTQQYGSQERLEEAYGMSVEKIKREMKEDTRKNLMAEMLKNQKFAKIDVTRREVNQFYETYKDSLGLVAEKFEIAHIFINPKSTDKLKKKAKAFAQSLRDSIANGADFDELAKKNSDDVGSAKAGGDLGFVKRGVFYPEFESAAFGLKEGELSQVIESPVGFHVIELIEKRGESIRARHILVKPKSDDAADLKAIEELTDIRDSVISNKNNFSYYASKFSNDKETAKFGGALGTFEAGQLEKSMLDQVYKMKEGDISFPKRLDVGNGEYGFHIIKLLKRIPEHKPTLETDFNEIKKITEFRKREKLYKDWVAEMKDKIYWEIRI
ncbi:MAG: peptidylprolyl isomerase [Ignavibacteriales bacterium]|nr:peptidylprolyl isomerase [Ignavibacteriota bacterium]MCB9249151.1 peptidylprolyl isomerase [Ignavibacteriales bacterium]